MPTEPSEVIALTILTVATSVAALVAVLVVYLVQAGRHRAGAISTAASLSLVGPVCGVGAASKHLAQTFSDIASSGGGGPAALVAGCARAQNLMCLGDGAAIVTLVLAAGLGWRGARSPSQSGRPPVSPGRLLALFALLIVPAIVVGSLHENARTTNQMAVALAEAPTAGPGQPGEGPAVVQALVSRMSRGVLLGVLGAPVVLIVLAGFAVTSAILGWKSELPPPFRIAGTLLLLAIAALAAAGILLFERPVLLPR